MPPSLVAVVVLEAAVVLLSVGLRVMAGEGTLAVLPSLLIPTLLLYGFVKGHRLAWQWGRIAGFVGAGLVVGVAVLSAVGGRFSPAVAAVFTLTVGAPLLAIAVLLGRPPARAWFKLVCPACQGRNVRAADLLFSRARCRACGSLF
jgi:hypothetical protein